ncbi:MAG TPA: lasso peptide biosynthesis B2 protein [Gaiellaceae bacterium]|nr:lasso peptide biosynthesis B2 protein [Gaiellaceae bacterium]
MLRSVERLRLLTAEQRTIVAASALLLPFVRLSLRTRGFRRTADTLTRWSERRAGEPDTARARLAAEAVTIVARRPNVGARCLERSLVLWFLLRRRGIDVDLLMGAEPPRGGSLPAHAWVELSGVPLNEPADVRERFGSFDLRLPRLAPPADP